MKLSALWSDGLVLQRDSINKIWGTADGGAPVCVKIYDGEEVIESLCLNADLKGHFEGTLNPRNASGPFAIELSSGKEIIKISNVMFGDVFLLTGQSNMELPVSRTLDLTKEYVSKINKPLIRQFEVPKEFDFKGPVDDIYSGTWKEADQDNVYMFSAVGYFFAEHVLEDENVAVGLIQTAVGGIQLESIMPEDMIHSLGEKLRKIAIEKGETPEKNCVGGACGKNHCCKFCYEEKMAFDKDDEKIKENTAKEMKEAEAFYGWMEREDIGLKHNFKEAKSLYLDNEAKRLINIPGRWEDFDEYPELEFVRGSVWVLKNFNIPKSMEGIPGLLKLGTLIDADETFINGVKIGQTDYRYPPRRYPIAEGLLKAGNNTIVVRVKISQRAGGFLPEMPYEINLDNGYNVALNGKWEVRIGATMGAKSIEEVKNQEDMIFYLFRPYGMYNKMIYPIRNVSLKAMLFYQGESNAENAWEFEYLYPEFIKHIRTLFGQEDLPVAAVQLPYFGGEDAGRFNTSWDDFRAAQASCAVNLSNHVLVDMYDLGFKYEIHCQNKMDVAQRLYDNFKGMLY